LSAARADVERLTKERDELREKLSESDAAAAKMREEIESLKSQLAEAEEDRAATHAKLSQMTGRLEYCRKNYELCDKDREKAFAERYEVKKENSELHVKNASLSESLSREAEMVDYLRKQLDNERQFSAVDKHTIEAMKTQNDRLSDQIDSLCESIEGKSGWRATVASISESLERERSCCDECVNKYRSELQRQLNEAWMRIDYKTADRIADLLGVKRPSDHEREDLKPFYRRFELELLIYQKKA